MPAGHVSTGPPNLNGGNVDTKHITVGSTVYLPVFVEGKAPLMSSVLLTIH